ncbi:uncharacterized protein LOC119742129 isoform X1 [Patiria miniata]|uniref:Tyr recombinase domain-containing protein n=1 Tax=Patiria miniata TaxID=46514 RepID=A0A914BCX7_PATMI|nr:uncharacterized protein LOC119719490 [Patiria miniata]XP_038044897.1 uncharacterized protein LOC119719490 [Patiria miniata]XP_038074088.1 uncharacterized protein LOC119742129 isoform X1 [Patiria miniata]XP_038074089.1 uncharacterized protein LOC119742129 isoform X1 [Patiria miniata]
MILDASRAPSTTKKYNAAFAAWQQWCKVEKINPLPANANDVCRYFIHLFNIGAPFSRIESVFYGLKWRHDCFADCKENPCDSKFLHNVLQGLKRRLAKPVEKKEPITPEILKAVIDKYAVLNSLLDIRLCTMLLISYAGFLRHSELINIRRCDLQLHSSYVNIFIVKSKTDIFRQGAWVIISATNTSTCPVRMLNRYLILADLVDEDSDESFLFRPANYIRTENKYKLRSGQLSYSRCLDIFKSALSSVGVNPKRFGLHSLRAGGATAAARIGVPDRLFKKHGRWRSETAKDGYVHESLEDRLSVSKMLGL